MLPFECGHFRNPKTGVGTQKKDEQIRVLGATNEPLEFDVGIRLTFGPGGCLITGWPSGLVIRMGQARESERDVMC